MRGEHGARSRVQHRHVGSSPHARGAQDGAQLVPGGNGIIPACAGSTTLSQLTATSAEDHPRMRGEHLQWYGPQSAHLGSSPHARGARFELARDQIVTGRWDHPRMRGEHM